MADDDPFQSNRPFSPFLYVPQHLYASRHHYSTGPYRTLSEQPYAMPEKSYRALWCLVVGDSTPFELHVPTDVSISWLKNHIFEAAGLVTLYAMVAKDLTLWQVRHLHTPENLPAAHRFL
jgi:hypothetical protein